MLHYYQQTKQMPVFNSSVSSPSESLLRIHNIFISLCLLAFMMSCSCWGKENNPQKNWLTNKENTLEYTEVLGLQVRLVKIFLPRASEHRKELVPANDLRFQRVEPQNWLNVPLPTRANWISERMFQSSVYKSDCP